MLKQDIAFIDAAERAKAPAKKVPAKKPPARKAPALDRDAYGSLFNQLFAILEADAPRAGGQSYGG